MIYPSPSYAAHIWYADGKLRLGLPAEGDARGHTIDIELSERGLHLLARLLTHRAANSRAKIGTPAAPTQYDLRKIEQALRTTEVKRARKSVNNVDVQQLLEELGL